MRIHVKVFFFFARSPVKFGKVDLKVFIFSPVIVYLLWVALKIIRVFFQGIELVDPKMRSWAATVVAVFYPFGAVYIGFVAWYFQNWRKILIISYAPGLLFVLYFW